jgi:hypothetical protein
MTIDERIQALRDLIEFREPIAVTINRLRRFPWDSDTELATLTRNDLIRILDAYLAGKLSDADVEEWAEALEGRDDIGYESQQGDVLREIIFELANPLLTTPIEPAQARRWRDSIGRLD